MKSARLWAGALAMCLAILGCAVATTDAENLNRSILPIQPPPHEPITEMDVRNAQKPEAFEIEAPEGAPNIVVVLIDDIGFGATETFGGPIETPTFEELANEGLRFNRFHTTALWSPTVVSSS